MSPRAAPLAALLGVLAGAGAPGGAITASRSPAPEWRAAEGIPPALATLPFESADDLVFLRARVNGRGPVWLLLDTGAGVTVLDRGQASELGLRERGRKAVRGMGEGTVEAGITHKVDLALGPLTFRVPTAFTLDLTTLRETAGHDVAGVLGYDLLRRWVVAIDYAAGVVRLYDPATFHYSGPGRAVPLRIEHEHAYLTADVDFDGSGELRSRPYMIDTGASRALIDPALGSAPGGRATIGGTGIGAEGAARLVRVPAVRLGGVRFEGALGVSGRLAAIGAGLLRRFVAFLDYPAGRLILVPGVHLHDGFPADASGLLLRQVAGTGKVVVHAALEDTPAAAAGLRRGDVIERVDGTPARDLGLDRLRALLRRDGAEVRLSVRRGEQRLELRLRLVRLL